jgi:hypothetical protein
MRTFLFFALAVFVAGSARADATQDALTEIAKCADIADSAARLQRFDAAVPKAKSALAAPAQKPRKRAFSNGSGFRVQRSP